MEKKFPLFLGIGLIAVAAAVGAYLYITRPLKAPSQQATFTPPATETNTPVESPTTEPLQNVTSNTYQIDPSASQVEFNIFEELRGKPVTVVGVTNQVTGSITADRTNLSGATMSDIRINARTLKTDSTQRDGAIGRLILESEKDSYEYIVFKPTRIEGLPASADIGTEFTFKATGSLTIRDIARNVTFTGTAKFVSDTELTGSAQATVRRADFNLNIPDLPFLANLGTDVTLKVNLSAKK